MSDWRELYYEAGLCNKGGIKCTIVFFFIKCQRRNMAQKETENHFMCQNFSLVRFSSNANCSSVWSLFHYVIWHISSLRLAEALSTECDWCLKQRARIVAIHWQTRSTMMILINDSLNIYGNDLLKTGSCFWLLDSNTQLITEWLALISFSYFHLGLKTDVSVIVHITTSIKISPRIQWNINNPNDCGLVINVSENCRTKSHCMLLF